MDELEEGNIGFRLDRHSGALRTSLCWERGKNVPEGGIKLILLRFC